MAARQFLSYRQWSICVPEGHFAEEQIKAGLTPEAHVDRVISEHMREGFVAIDVGANIGFHTLALASIAGGRGAVYAVEADVSNVVCLHETLSFNGISNTTIIPVAASDTTGLLNVLHSDRTNNILSPIAQSGAQKIVSLPLDACVNERVDLVKIDIEGAELLALRGMSRILTARPALIMEFSPGYIQRALGTDRSPELLALLFGLGYSVSFISPDGMIEPLVDATAVVAKRDYAFHELHWGHIDLLCKVK